MFVNARRDIFVVCALNHDGHATRRFHILNGALHLAAALGKRLAALVCNGESKIFAVRHQQFPQLEHGNNAVADRSATPS